MAGRWRVPPGVALLAGLVVLSTAHARSGEVRWKPRRLTGCEPNHVFYSDRHVPGRRPCCPMVPMLCPGGTACPESGVCQDAGVPCDPRQPALRPNVVLMVTDDQGECHYGHAGECRTVSTGTPIPAPVTPNLDLLAGHGTVFPVAHNTASWCFPSLNSIVTGRMQRSFGSNKRVGDVFLTIPKALRKLEGDPTTIADPYDPGNVIGGYCTFLGGKFPGSLGDIGFDALARTNERQLGRTKCDPGIVPSDPPRCGSESQPSYEPLDVFRMGDLFAFLDGLLHPVPGSDPPEYRIQNFFAWYAPRIPHQPLRAPLPINDYLFGPAGVSPLGGAFQLSRYCEGASCAPLVDAFDEAVFGTVRELYGSLWWVDDNVREIRQFLERASAPHCIVDGRSRHDVHDETACVSAAGTWAIVGPDLSRNTVIIQVSDNGWHLPSSKHHYTENGRRTRVIVFDPMAIDSVPGSNPEGQVIPPAHASEALVQTPDLLPTILGYALGTTPGTQICPASNGSFCDGRDLRGHLATAPGGAAPAAALRHAMCGHHTQKSTTATNLRHIITRAGSIGRCTDTTAPTCASSSSCGPDEFCLGGHCMSALEPACTETAACPNGAVCLGGRCRSGPPCVDDTDCTGMFPASGSACVAHDERWCANAPDVACSTREDCPACPSVNGASTACRRLCEPRRLKYYVTPGTGGLPIPRPQLTDLFLDPDEVGLHKGLPGVVRDMSEVTGPYETLLRRLNCCVDDWWSNPKGTGGTLCRDGDTCPADLACDG